MILLWLAMLAIDGPPAIPPPAVRGFVAKVDPKPAPPRPAKVETPAPPKPDPRIAQLESEVATLRRQLAERDAAPGPPDIGPAYSCRFADGRTAQGWIIRGPAGDRFVEDKDR